MNRKQAAEVFGLSEWSSADDILQRYQDLHSRCQLLLMNAQTPELRKIHEQKIEELQAAAAALLQPRETAARDYPTLSPIDQGEREVNVTQFYNDKKENPVSAEPGFASPPSAAPLSGASLFWKAVAAMTALVVFTFSAWLLFRDDGEEAAWQVVKDSSNRVALDEFLKHYPKGKYSSAAKVKLKDIESKNDMSNEKNKEINSPSKLNLLPSDQEKAGQEIEFELNPNVKIKMVWIPPGVFSMGSMSGQPNERPVHPVRISKGFWMGRFEVTQAQWEAVMGENPSYFRGCQNCPVESVSWNGCQEFIYKLNQKHPLPGGWSWRLPTEAEWEYACRAGTTGDYNADRDLGDLAWYEANSNRSTQPVGRKQPNQWGLYDMHGNVWEWCLDWYGERYSDRSRSGPEVDPRGPSASPWNQRILRGGAWDQNAFECRSADRRHNNPAIKLNDDGLRVVIGAR